MIRVEDLDITNFVSPVAYNFKLIKIYLSQIKRLKKHYTNLLFSLVKNLCFDVKNIVKNLTAQLA